MDSYWWIVMHFRILLSIPTSSHLKFELRTLCSIRYHIQCSQLSGADSKALALNIPLRHLQGWYGRPGKASVHDIHGKTVGWRSGPPVLREMVPPGRAWPFFELAGVTCRAQPSLVRPGIPYNAQLSWVMTGVTYRYSLSPAGTGGVTCVHVPVTVHRSGQCRISYV